MSQNNTLRAIIVEEPLTFEALLYKMGAIHLAKAHDYCGGKQEYDNYRQAERIGIPAWKGVLLRILEKVSRIETFSVQEELFVKDESIEDTLIDMANLSLICLILYKEKKDSKSQKTSIKAGMKCVVGNTDIL